MPSTSPGHVAPAQIIPGAPLSGLQSPTSFTFQWKRYVAYASGAQLNLLTAPTDLVQGLTFSEDLVAVVAENGKQGKIAVASKRGVWILEPVTSGCEHVRWEKARSLKREDAADEARTLSWGDDNGELLVGASRTLALFSTLPRSRTSTPGASPVDEEFVEEHNPLWCKAVSSPVAYASFGPSANLIASCGARDRLVKIWRRLSFEEGLFDHAYLPHPASVTHLEWRPSDERASERRGSGLSGRQDDEAEVLYTVASDGVLRVWRTGNHHDLDILVLHTVVDLVTCIAQSPTLTTHDLAREQKPARYAFIIPSHHFCAAVSSILVHTPTKPTTKPNIKHQINTTKHTLEHLKEVCSRTPDVIVTLDGHGRMSAWGLSSVGHKRRPDTPSLTQPFHVCHYENLSLQMSQGGNARFLTWFEEGKMVLLVHDFGGKVGWWRGEIERFFGTSTAGPERLQRFAEFSGHSAPIAGLCVAENRSGLLTWSKNGEIIQWKQGAHETFERESIFSDVGCKVRQAALLGSGRDLFVLSSDSVSLLGDRGHVIAAAAHGLGEGVRLVSIASPLDTAVEDSTEAVGHYLLLGRVGHASKLTVTAPAASSPRSRMRCSPPYTLYKINGRREALLHMTIASHPRKYGWKQITGVKQDGEISIHDIKTEELEIPSTHDLCDEGNTYQTGLKAPRMLEMNIDFAALASSDSTQLAIVDLQNGYIEQRCKYDRPISQLNFITSLSGGEGRSTMLAVASQDKVEVLAPKHYERHSELPNWVCIKRTSIAGLGLVVRAVDWLGDGRVMLAAGNGLIIGENSTSAEEVPIELRERLDLAPNAKTSLLHVTECMKRPLPVWHPRFLSRLARYGKLRAAFNVLRRLEEALKFWSEGDALHPTLGTDPRELISRETQLAQRGLDERTWTSLFDLLEEKNLPTLSWSEQDRLKRVVEALRFSQEHMDALDGNAMCYLLNWKLRSLHTAAKHEQAHDGNPNGKLTNGANHSETQDVPAMGWREIAFAYHSSTQQPLLDILILHYDNKVTWPLARQLGITSWIRELWAAQTEGSSNASLEQILDKIAQSAYRSTQPPDPVNGSLFFLVLRQKARLLALWRIATWHREQRSTMNFLRRDFSVADAKTAAKKNAYALMGKRRFEYAAAFFLLADDPQSAVSVLGGQCGDIGLAIVVARMYCGDGSDCVRKLLGERVLPAAERDGDRWCMSWCHSVMGDQLEAANALVNVLARAGERADEEVVPSARSWEQGDPATLVLYRHVRTARSYPGQEYAALLEAARMLRRMGLPLLALDLLSEWNFPRTRKQLVKAEEELAAKIELAVNGDLNTRPTSLLDGFTSPAVQRAGTDSPSIFDGSVAPAPAAIAQAPVDEKSEREKKAAELLANLKARKEQSGPAAVTAKKTEPTQFKEPNADSLLDSFGF